MCRLALEYTPADQKSLYRRANAFERAGKLREAISDAQRLMSISAKGSTPDEQTYALLRKLRESAQSKVRRTAASLLAVHDRFPQVSQQTQLNSQVQQMFETITSKPDQQETV